MVVGDVARFFEPPSRDPVEDLTLERQRAEHAIEGGDAIADDDRAFAIARIIVANLALVALAIIGEVGPGEWVGEGFSDFSVGGHEGRELRTRAAHAQ